MLKEKRKNSVFFTLSTAVILIVLTALWLMQSLIIVHADDGVSTLSDVDTTNIASRYQSYNKDDVLGNITDNLYYDTTLSNDGNSNVLSDSWFAWSAGANVMNNDIGKLVFTLNLNNTSYSNSGNIVTSTQFTKDLTFTLKKASKDTNTCEEILSVKLLIVGDISVGLLIKQSKFSNETIGIAGLNFNTVADAETRSDGYLNIGTSSTVEDLTPFYGDTNKILNIVIEPAYLTDEYFMTLDYGFSTSGTSALTNSIDSKIVSVYDIIKQMSDRDELSCLNEEQQTKANELLNDGTLKKVQVSWLERVGKTPFATKKYDWVEVPVVNNMISPSDVATALGIESFAVGQSSCQYFKEDTNTGIFNAYYLKNVWLSSKDAQGNSMNLFLDINSSYKDYYYPFVRDGIFTEGMYEWFWSTMIVKYPEISGIDDGNLYGYFGYTSVPYTYSLDQLIYEMFNGSPNMDGIVRYFSYRDNLSYESYMKLLDDYNYGWLEKGWNTVAGFVAGSKYPADHYFFYCDGEEDNAFIGENGADDIYDNSGALVNGAEDVVEGIGEVIGVIFNNPITKWIALGICVFLVSWLVMLFFSNFFKVKKARQEYKNSKRRRR